MGEGESNVNLCQDFIEKKKLKKDVLPLYVGLHTHKLHNTLDAPLNSDNLVTLAN